MKIAVSAADIRQTNEALSRCAAAREWARILQKAGIEPREELDRVAAAEKIATGLLEAFRELDGQPL